MAQSFLFIACNMVVVGGFLARDWCQGSPAAVLTTKSFDMHMELAKEFVECDYRRLDTLAVTAKHGTVFSQQQ